MKKFFLLFSCMMIFTIFFNFNSVNADETDPRLLITSDFTIKDSGGIGNSAPEKAVDGDPTTKASIRSGSQSFELNTPSNLISFSINSARTLIIKIYDDENNIIKTVNSSQGDNIIDVSDISNKVAKMVVVTSSSTGTTIYYDMVIYGSTPLDHSKDIQNFTAVQSLDTVSLLWDELTDKTHIESIILYRNGQLYKTLSTSSIAFSDNNVVMGQTYTYKLTVKYSDEYISNGSVQTVTMDDTQIPKDETAPSDITNLETESFKDSIKLKFTNPTDKDFRLVNIYVDNQLVGTSLNGTFTVIGLKPEQDYNIVLKSVDSSGNESNGVVKSVQTLSEKDVLPPDAPSGLKAENFSNGSTISWNKNKESDIQGYNVYIDGVKVNTSLIPNTSYTLKGLDKNKSYSVSVTAVDTSNNESVQSLLITARPNPDALPIIETGFELKDIAEGTANTFNSLWMVVAFASAIPLSFYVAGRVKLLFL